MDVRELIKRLHTIKMYTNHNSTARNMLEELINQLKTMVPR